MASAGILTDRKLRQRIGLASLVGFFIVVCCLSFALGSRDYSMAYIFYDAARLPYAVAAVAAFAVVGLIFVFARFSFGYLVGFYCYTMILGYLWLNSFSPFNYDHRLAGASAAISAVAFLLPALLITSPVRQIYTLSEKAMQRLLRSILLFAAAIAVIGSVYNFRLIAVTEIYAYREQLYFPTIVNYATAATMTVLLPYAFACYVARKSYWWAGAALLLSVCFYPITLTKVALFMPAWLVMLVVLGKIFEARMATILSLLLPVLAGVILFVSVHDISYRYFNIVNMRMIIAPSSAMDFYNEYFTRNGLTHFCQIWILKPFISCSLEVPLSVEMANNYGLGNMNASLFATEGIASVGLWFAPVSAFFCGLVVAIGNRASAGLPENLVLVSSGILPQIFMNVPLTVILLTHGTALLFVLWYVTPRTISPEK
ncbi:hypothetical protein IVB30_11730 [Bradyrhizobium sp. 200]|uniref:hypothetical protein n=1 Tax=Bradyrhizobium sp. 200 TaxID=2782665 RepID=UPI001FFEBDED|nr:hypothetical protein [Bradyrhizobium sp. 200]UPJ51952.1 hypothetical protein IVB30_11730 [Bradyrhizobium sp. 200]